MPAPVTAENADAERAQTQLNELAQISLPEEIHTLARAGILHPSEARHNLVDRLLTNDLQPERFREEYNQLEIQETSWATIFNVQRHTRDRIRNVNNLPGIKERVEAYAEMLPRKRMAFSSLVQEVTNINRKDLTLDTGIKAEVGSLTQERERQGQPALPALLTENQAIAVVELDTTTANFEVDLNRVLTPLRNAAAGNANDPNTGRAREALNRIRTFKQQERAIEQRMNAMLLQLDRIISLNVSRAEREAERRRMLREASRFCGVRIQAGTRLRYHYEFRDQDVIHGDFDVQIRRVSMDQVPIRDHQGRIIGQAIGAPVVHLSNGQAMPLSRFKKWVDAADAHEIVESQDELLQLLGWRTLGIPLAPGLSLEYQTYASDRVTGRLKRVPHTVRILEIHDNRIYFDEAVLYQHGPGAPGMKSTDEYRESLSYGEFYKWYLRQEVEQAFNINELRGKLEIFNREYNREFNLRPEDNPVITVTQEEEFYYADDPLSPFRISNISGDTIELNTGERYTPAQFFHWVKENNVQRVPDKGKNPEEVAQKEAEYAALQAEEAKFKEAEKVFALEKEEAKIKGPPGEPAGFLNFFKEAWFKTTFLAPRDIWSMIISIKEFVERKHKRKSQGRYSHIGQKLPGILGTEFRRIAQSAETEEVNLNKEAMHQWGIFDVLDRLKTTNDKDVAKACIITLVDKGEMRWDEVPVWETLNRLTARYTTRGAELYIPNDKKYLERVGKSGEDMTAPACDALWGTGTHAEWFGKNTSTIDTQKKHFEFKGKQLEADPKNTGGLKGEMKRLLLEWKEKGNYVNPHEYEELIDFGLKYGKMSAEDKMFYLIMGIISENPKGYGTLLHLDRAGAINGVLLNQFPLLDFFTDKGVTRPDGTVGPWRVGDFEVIAHHWFSDDAKKGEPGMEFSKFFWHYMMFNNNFRVRMSKGLRNAENMDHEDAPYFVAPASYTEIDMITGSPGGGEKKFFTPEGYASAYCGFSQYLISIVNSKELLRNEEKRQQSLKDAIKSFVWYDATLDNRFRKFEGAKKARLSEHHFNKSPTADNSCKLSLHRDQLRNLIREIGKEYGMSFEYLFEKTGPTTNAQEAARRMLAAGKPGAIVNISSVLGFGVMKSAETSESGLQS